MLLVTIYNKAQTQSFEYISGHLQAWVDIAAHQGQLDLSTVKTALESVTKKIETYEANDSSAHILFTLVGLFLTVFGILIAIHRFHLLEISRTQKQLLGLKRIRIAGNNYDLQGFRSEVRESLTKDAFDDPSVKEKKVQSPLPGHPTSDFATTFANKILENVSIEYKSKATDPKNKS